MIIFSPYVFFIFILHINYVLQDIRSAAAASSRAAVAASAAMTAVAMTQAAAARAATRAARALKGVQAPSSSGPASTAALPSGSPAPPSSSQADWPPYVPKFEDHTEVSLPRGGDHSGEFAVQQESLRMVHENTVAHSSAEAVSDVGPRPPRTVIAVSIPVSDDEGLTPTFDHGAASPLVSQDSLKLEDNKVSEELSTGSRSGVLSFLWGVPSGVVGWVQGWISPSGKNDDTPSPVRTSAPAPSEVQPRSDAGPEALGAASINGPDGGAPKAEANGRSWWQFISGLIGRGGGANGGEAANQGLGEASGATAVDGSNGDGAVKPVEAIIIPADLPIEEIAM